MRVQYFGGRRNIESKGHLSSDGLVMTGLIQRGADVLNALHLSLVMEFAVWIGSRVNLNEYQTPKKLSEFFDTVEYHEDSHPIEYHVGKNADDPPLPLSVDCVANRVPVAYKSSTRVAMVGWGKVGRTSGIGRFLKCI